MCIRDSRESGQLVAIMGGSGVGKSTLLSILNGNIIPGEGNVCLNGHPLSDPECKQLIGFVPQDDLLIEELTVFQNLWYTARLCFANLTKKEIEDRVNTILEDLDLSKIRDLAVGSPIRKTISGGPVSYTHLDVYKRQILDREQLTNLFVLLDCRHEAQKIDLEFMEWLGESGVPFSIIFTKIDKISKGRLKENLKVYTDKLLETWEELPPIFLSSSEKKEGRDEILDYIESINNSLNN